jgi:hypothetical protein
MKESVISSRDPENEADVAGMDPSTTRKRGGLDEEVKMARSFLGTLED